MKLQFKQIIKLPYRVIRKIIYIFLRISYKIYKFPVKPTIVICMDGGLCSQMFEYAPLPA